MTSPNSFTRRTFLRNGSLLLAGAATGLHFAAREALGQTSLPAALSIGVVTDIHYADKPPMGARYFRDALAKLRLAVESFNSANLDLVVHNGDLIDTAPDKTLEGELAGLKIAEAELAKCKAPRHYVLGNHCVTMLTKSEFREHTAAKETPYSFDHNGFHLVLLDACFNEKLEPYQRNNFMWNDSNMPPAQIDWLKNDLKTNTLPTIVFVHQRLDGAANYSVKQAPAVREILEQSRKVALVVQGHSHQNDHKQINGIDYVVLRAIIEGAGNENAAHSHLLAYADGSIQIKGFAKQENYRLGKSA